MNLDLSTGLPELHDSSLRWYVGAKTEFNGFDVNNAQYLNAFIEIQRETKISHYAQDYKRFLFWDFPWGTRKVENENYTTVKRIWIVTNTNDSQQDMPVLATSLTPELILKHAEILYEEYLKGLSALELLGAYPPKKLVVGEADE